MFSHTRCCSFRYGRGGWGWWGGNFRWKSQRRRDNGEVAIGREAGDDTVGDWIGDALGIPSREYKQRVTGFYIIKLKIPVGWTIQMSNGFNC